MYRWLYYDGLGRVAGYRQGKWTSFPGNLSFDVTGTACRYDADGQMYIPCNTTAPPLSFDGANVIGTINGWRYIHAPGVDEPLLARREDATGYWQRELYFVTDGQGRQLSVGDLKGSFNSQDGDAGYEHGGWRFGGAARGATGFGAARFDSPALPGVSLFRNRAYDSRTGRWTQEDPIGVAGGLNLYQFNGNDPVAYTDPFGLCPFCFEPTEIIAAYVGWSYGHSESAQVAGAIGDFVSNYEDMRRANTIGADKYFHAKANCEAAQRGSTGHRVAEIISDLREQADQMRGDSEESSEDDQKANRIGRDAGAGQPRGSCSEMVKDSRPSGLSEEY